VGILFLELYGQEGLLQVHKVSLGKFISPLSISLILLCGIVCIIPTHGHSESSAGKGSRLNAGTVSNKPDLMPILFLSTTSSVIKVGEVITLTVLVERIEQLYSSPFHLTYNPSLLELIKVSEGDFLKKDGKETAFFQANNSEAGQVVIGLSRLGQVGGVTGSGILATFTFRSKSSGVGKFSIKEPEFRNAAMESIPIKVVLTEVRVE